MEIIIIIIIIIIIKLKKNVVVDGRMQKCMKRVNVDENGSKSKCEDGVYVVGRWEK